MTKVTVRKHTRRRTGRTAQRAERLGFDPTVEVDTYARRRPRERPVSVGGEGPSGEKHFQRMYPNNAYVASLDGRVSGVAWTWEAYHHGLKFDGGFTQTKRRAEQDADRAVAKHQRMHP